jgi:type IX secretion system PorP/SprF family membrane protein
VDIESYNKLDAAFSSLFYNKYFWAGFNIDHLIPSNTSFLNQDGKIPLSYTVTGGYNLIYKPSGWRNPYDESITFSGLVQHQGKFNQLDVGVTWTKNIFQVGVAYRNFILPTSTVSSHDALIPSLGLNMDMFKVVYSYDISLSTLHNLSGGSHELSVQFFFDQKERSAMSFFCR